MEENFEIADPRDQADWIDEFQGEDLEFDLSTEDIEEIRERAGAKF